MTIHKTFFGLARSAVLGVALLFGLTAAVLAQSPDGIKIAPTLPALGVTPNSELPADIAAQLTATAPGSWAVAEVKAGTGVYYITDGNYQALVIKHSGGIILVDAPQPLPFFGNMPIQPALDLIAPGEPVTHMIYSHAHTDHIGGASAIVAANPNVKIIGHILTRKELTAVNDSRRPAPKLQNTFLKKRMLRIGGQKIELHYFGDTHMPGNTFVWLPDHKILMAVDIVYPGWVPFRRLALSTSIRGWLKGHEAVDLFDFDFLVPGHLTRVGDTAIRYLGTKDDAAIAKEYNADIKAAIDSAYWDSNTFFTAVGAVFGSGADAFGTAAKWALFSAFYDASTQGCTEALHAKWGDNAILAGGETFNFSNCEAYFVALRIGNVAAPAP